MPQAVTDKPDMYGKATEQNQPPTKRAITPTVAANETTVSANLVDLGGTAWAGALITINFQPAPNIPGPYFWGGGLFSLRPQLTADSTGHFSITLPDNTTITPAGSTWQFVIAPNATMPAVIFNLMIAGAAMDISSVFTAQSYQVSLGTVQSLPLPRAYVNSDVASPSNSGQIFFNTDAHSVMLWDENQWNPIASVQGITYPPGTDPDYFNFFGSAGIPSGTYGLPDNTLTQWNIVTFPGAIDASGRIQLAASYNDAQFRIWIRASFGFAVPPDWSPWRVIPYVMFPGTVDLNNLIISGTYILEGVNGNLPSPVNNSSGAVLEILGSTGSTLEWAGIQRLTCPWSTNPNNIYTRQFTAPAGGAVTWSPWYVLTPTAV